MPQLPDLTVEAALDPVGDPDTWTDVTADVRSVNVSRGKQRELDRFRAGRAELVLRNDTRAYDPAVEPGWKPNRPVRVQAEWAAVTYPVYYGYIDAVRQDYIGPHRADASVTTTDGFKLLARSQLPSGAHAVEILADGPAHWYRLDEPDDATSLYDTAGGRHLTIQGAIDQVASLVARDANPAIGIAHDSGALSDAQPKASGVTAVTVELMFQWDGDSVGGELFFETDGTVSVGWVLNFNPPFDDGIAFGANVVTSSGAAALSYSYPDTSEDTDPHHLLLRWDGTTAYLYIDGVERDSAAVGGTMFTAGTQTRIAIGGPDNGPLESGAAPGTYDEAVVYYTDLGTTRAAAHYETVATPWDNDTPEDRFARILDHQGWPAGLRDLGAGTSTLQSATLGQTALEHLQKTAESDFGTVFIGADGAVVFKGRASLINLPSVADVSDAHGPDPAVMALAPEITDELIRNDVTVSRLDGKAQRSTDPDSIEEHGPVTYTREGLYHDSDTLSKDMADFIVSEYSQPLQRVSAVTIRPDADPDTLYPIVLGVELNDVVTLEHTPQGTGAAVTQRSVVEGIEHTVTPAGWTTRWNLSPALTGTIGVWDDPEATWDNARWFF